MDRRGFRGSRCLKRWRLELLVDHRPDLAERLGGEVGQLTGNELPHAVLAHRLEEVELGLNADRCVRTPSAMWSALESWIQSAKRTVPSV